MRCPFLREEQVKSCQASALRKAIARSALRGDRERCTSPDYVNCPTVLERHEDHPSPDRCPFLRESLVQYCAASPVPTYVPWSESPDLRCAHDGHRFCDLYLAVAGSTGRGPASSRRGAETGVVDVAGIAMPAWLLYASNHMWLDVGDDGLVHVGIDAFLTRLAGTFDGLAFLTPKGRTGRPAVALTVQGVDLNLVFAHRLQITAANTHLRSDLDRLAADPYGAGWLFEGRLPDGGGSNLRGTDFVMAGLCGGEAARAWMRQETRRLSETVHDRFLSRPSQSEPLLADGGESVRGLLAQLRREEILQLFALFFPLPGERGGAS